MQMENLADFHLNIMELTTISVLLRTLKISIIKNGAVLMMIVLVVLNGEIVHVTNFYNSKIFVKLNKLII